MCENMTFDDWIRKYYSGVYKHYLNGSHSAKYIMEVAHAAWIKANAQADGYNTGYRNGYDDGPATAVMILNQLLRTIDFQRLIQAIVIVIYKVVLACCCITAFLALGYNIANHAALLILSMTAVLFVFWICDEYDRLKK